MTFENVFFLHELKKKRRWFKKYIATTTCPVLFSTFQLGVCLSCTMARERSPPGYVRSGVRLIGGTAYSGPLECDIEGIKYVH